jgi:hypothetical protein
VHGFNTNLNNFSTDLWVRQADRGQQMLTELHLSMMPPAGCFSLLLLCGRLVEKRRWGMELKNLALSRSIVMQLAPDEVALVACAVRCGKQVHGSGDVQQFPLFETVQLERCPVATTVHVCFECSNYFGSVSDKASRLL